MHKDSSNPTKPRQYPTDILPNSREIASAKDDLKADELALHRLKVLEEIAFGELEDKRREILERVAEYHVERDIIRANQFAALSFIAPIRRLPLEIYKEIFLFVNALDLRGRAAWHISAVCRLWRRIALSTPNLWSNIRFYGHLGVSPDIIRLWVERSGSSVLLDIDIEISRRGRYSSSKIKPSLSRSHALLPPRLRGAQAHPPDDNIHRTAAQWGHVALFYLMAQKHRWRTFYFESLEVSIEALQMLQGKSTAGGDSSTPVLRKLTLDHVNFSWNSGVLKGLTSLRINFPAPMIYHPHPASMDAIFGILVNNPDLRSLDLCVQALQTSALPSVEPLSLPKLTTLSLEGAPHFTTLLQHLTLEGLKRVNIRFDTPQSHDFGQSFKDLLIRSNFPPIVSLTVQQPYRMQETNLIYLEHLVELEEFTVSRLPMEDILLALSANDSDGKLVCPNLRKLTLQYCHGRRDLESVIPKLIKFVEKRTGTRANGVQTDLEHLRISNCGCVIAGHTESWLKSRLKELVVEDFSGSICVPSIPQFDWEIFT
ncbi:571_t:CDS:2 [Acaulospora colombiana]|uniref:571_t:CDS:1 n=1 Tax=Acaulospora colombiana TaxID=27376 RepID=A0ACA9MR77_9GLOM|nr:571_t:CDS:2 [Acaulospora colombiana]